MELYVGEYICELISTRSTQRAVFFETIDELKGYCRQYEYPTKKYSCYLLHVVSIIVNVLSDSVMSVLIEHH